MADGVAPKQSKPRGKGRPFAPGTTGNPKGRRPGLRNNATIAAEILLEGEAEALTRRCIEMAKGGDAVAMRLVLERILPVRRGRPVRFDVPPMDSPNDLTQAIGGVLHATAAGDLTPDEAATIAGILDVKRRAIELVEMEKRIADLEARAKGAAS